MKRYRFHYQSIIRFSAPVARHYFRLRCLPGNHPFQQVTDESLLLYPNVSLLYDEDVFGNRVQYGHTLEPHDAFIFTASGVAEQTPYRIPATEAWTLYRIESRLTQPSDELTAFGRSLQGCETADAATQADIIAHAIYNRMHYIPGSTGNETTAAQAFACGQGVCQDYTHIFLALCRLRHIPARYVNGFIPGIGFTHAWAEVYDGTAWIGIDPTHDQRIEYGYIKLAHGRDAADCPVNRGVFIGSTGQNSEVRVLVEEQ